MIDDEILVIGHVNPDTDSIASAIGYAWLLAQRDGLETIAARAGPVNPQTAWVLRKMGLEPPLLITDASPRFESVMRQLDSLAPDRPLSEAWSLASRTGGIAPLVDVDGKPFGLINGLSLFAFFETVFGHRLDLSDQRIADLMGTPCRQAADVQVPRFPAHGHIRDSLQRILREEHNDFFVVDEAGRYLGICHQRGVLNPPRLRLILVDHNEPRQAIASLDQAELIEILDHHRLGNTHTHQPIRFTVDVVGSTSTLVSELAAEAGLSPPAELAGLLLAGLLADTLILTSPTTTPRDQQAAERLLRWATAGGGFLKGESIQSFGQQVLSAGTGLDNRSPAQIVGTDLKTYESAGSKFAVAQVEVTDLGHIGERLEELLSTLNEMKERSGLDFSMLLITDVVEGSSRLLVSSNPPAVLEELPYPPLPDGSLDAAGVVSRKKQLLPAVLGLLEK
jgi:manganese-dependent inorganic pyrophosphatase